ncbi:MAG: nucleotide exchange factor GrpE [Candidatus Cloacimonetes bacterium]|nr:nucleotide exchange factor GrpE [Candidatus Cloacimonadota bacterium]
MNSKKKLQKTKGMQLEPEKTEDKMVSSQEQEESSGGEKQRLSWKDKYHLLESEIEALMDQKMRLAADFENFRRRTNSEKADWIKNATERLVLEICDVFDNFERALHPETEKSSKDSFRQGIELIFHQLGELLKKEGVKKIEGLGKEFDPQFHDALVHIPSDFPENKIVAVIQNGYTMNNKLIRAAKVAVSNGQKPVLPEDPGRKKDENDKDLEKVKQEDK